jgi:hypothetical protein
MALKNTLRKLREIKILYKGYKFLRKELILLISFFKGLINKSNKK